MAEDSPKFEVHQVHVCPDCDGRRRGCPTCSFTGEVFSKVQTQPVSVLVWDTDPEAATNGADTLFWTNELVLDELKPVLHMGYRNGPLWYYGSRNYADNESVLAWAYLPTPELLKGITAFNG
jgi:hypothetical protein